MSEKRRRPRQKTLLSGEIMTGGGSVFTCSVRDISEYGARLCFGNAIWVPDRFKLSVNARGWVAQAEVRWRKGNEVGVEFRSLRMLHASAPVPALGAA